jgi:hypothetical protein
MSTKFTIFFLLIIRDAGKRGPDILAHLISITA